MGLDEEVTLRKDGKKVRKWALWISGNFSTQWEMNIFCLITLWYLLTLLLPLSFWDMHVLSLGSLLDCLEHALYFTSVLVQSCLLSTMRRLFVENKPTPIFLRIHIFFKSRNWSVQVYIKPFSFPCIFIKHSSFLSFIGLMLSIKLTQDKAQVNCREICSPRGFSGKWKRSGYRRREKCNWCL